MEQETVDKIRRYREKYVAEMRASGHDVSDNWLEINTTEIGNKMSKELEVKDIIP